MRRAIPHTFVPSYHDGELGSRRWIARLLIAVTILSFMIPTCVYAGAAGSARPGLGVSRAAMQSVLASKAFAFKFDAPHEGHGLSRLTGTVPGKLILLSLVGPPENLTEVTLTVGVPSTDSLTPPAAPKVLAENARYLRAVLQHAMPDWKDGVKWLNTQLQRSDGRLEARVRKGQREIALLAVDRLSMVLLSIRVAQPPVMKGP